METWPTTPEHGPVSREAVLAALKANKEDPTTKELLSAWADQNIAEREKVTDKVEFYTVAIESSIDMALLYRDAGLLEEAWEELNTTGEIAYNAHRDDICDRIQALMDEIETKANSKE